MSGRDAASVEVFRVNRSASRRLIRENTIYRKEGGKGKNLYDMVPKYKKVPVVMKD